MIGTILSLSLSALPSAATTTHDDPAFCVRTHIDPDVCFESGVPASGDSEGDRFLECELFPFEVGSVYQRVQLTPDSVSGYSIADLTIEQSDIRLKARATVRSDGVEAVNFSLRHDEDSRPAGVFGTDDGRHVFGLVGFDAGRAYGECKITGRSQ